MTRRLFGIALMCILTLAVSPRHAAARRLALDLSLERGDAAVYQPGQELGIRTRVSEDAYLLVYVIDSEGTIDVLYPLTGRSGYIEGRKNVEIPPADSHLDLVASDPTGEGYVVAIASTERFKELPWYLRPFDSQAAATGYEGDAPEEEGVTPDGQIVGDPFVAMERIRRRVLRNPGDEASFATSYTSFYVHERVKYPRYLCADCHRPNYWSWWPGYDPYYATCSAFDFRANWDWSWGPSYWTGCVPYYVFAPTAGCPPGTPTTGITYSSWLGWNKWVALWGGKLKQDVKSPPAGYVSPQRYQNGRLANLDGRFTPPGFVAASHTSPLLRGSRGLTQGRFREPGDPGQRGMLTTHGSVPQSPLRTDRGARPLPAQTRGNERIWRPVGNPQPGSRVERGALQTPERYAPPQSSAPPQRYAPSPQRFAQPQPVAPPRFETPRSTVSAPAAPSRPSAPAPAPAPVRPSAPAPAPTDRGNDSGGHHR